MWNDNLYYFPLCGGVQNPDIVYGTTKRSYTMRIEQWLKSKYPELDPIDSDQLLQAGLDTVFKNMNLNVLSDQYKETFIIQFLNEFYMNEIGQETTDYFRQNLNRIIQNHGNYIKQLYEMAEKKYFIEYSYRTLEGAHEETTKSDGFRSNSVKSENSSEHSDSSTTDNTRSASGTENASGTASKDTSSEGEGTSSNTSNGSNVSSGSDSITHNTTDTTKYNTTDTHTVTDMKTKTDYGRKDTFEYGPNGEWTEMSGSETDTHDMKHRKEGSEKQTGHDLLTGDPNDGGNTMSRVSAYFGEESEEESFNNFTEHHETTRSYNNYSVERNGKSTAVGKFSDTPQNGLEGMGFSEGTGDYGEGGGNYGDGYDEYMSSAQINTKVQGSKESYNGSYTDDGDNTKNGSRTMTKRYGDGTPQDGSRRDTVSESEYRNTEIERNIEFADRYDWEDGTIKREFNGRRDTKKGGHSDQLSGTDTRTVNGSETNARTGQDSIEHKGDDTTKYGRTDTTNASSSGKTSSSTSGSSKTETSDERTTSNSETGKTVSNGSGNVSGTSSTDGTETTENNGKANGTNNQTEERYSYNRDAVFMSNDITDKIWALFDDCFMQVL